MKTILNIIKSLLPIIGLIVSKSMSVEFIIFLSIVVINIISSMKLNNNKITQSHVGPVPTKPPGSIQNHVGPTPTKPPNL